MSELISQSVQGIEIERVGGLVEIRIGNITLQMNTADAALLGAKLSSISLLS